MIDGLVNYEVDLNAVGKLAGEHATDEPGPLEAMFPGDTPAAVLAQVWRALLAAGAITSDSGPVGEVTVTEKGDDAVEVGKPGTSASDYPANVPARAALLQVAAERLASVLNGAPDQGIDEIRHHT